MPSCLHSFCLLYTFIHYEHIIILDKHYITTFNPVINPQFVVVVFVIIIIINDETGNCPPD